MDVMKKNRRDHLARRISVTLVAAACGLWTLAPMASAEIAAVTAPATTAVPTGGEVVAGDATIAEVVNATTNPILNINQTSDRAIIKWDSFDVGSGATVNFNQTKDGLQNTAAITLNRVNSANLSQIYGKINSIGSVVLVNPQGIIFGTGSEVNAAGIVASTEDLVNIDDEAARNKFITDGTYSFSQTNETDNNIIVNGTLNASINGRYLTKTGAGSYAQSLIDSGLNLGDRQVVTKVSTLGNKIILAADGDVALGSDAKLTAKTKTNVAATTEDKDLGGGITLTTNVAAHTAEGAVILRADQNANDLAMSDRNIYNLIGEDYADTLDGIGDNGDMKTAIVHIAETTTAPIESLNVSIYYNNPIMVSDAIDDVRVPATSLAKDASGYFYSKRFNRTINYSASVAQTVVQLENIAGSLSAIASVADAKQLYASLINNVCQLQLIDNDDRDSYLSNTYALGTDIDASDTANWKDWNDETKIGFNPIGSEDNAFTGTFTGDGGTGTYNIYDLTINRGSDSYIGLFAKNGNNATITDVTLVDPLIKGNTYVGGIVGWAEGATLENVSMRKWVSSLDDDRTAGTGLAATNAEVANVSANVNVGGIAGLLYKASITNAVNGGWVDGTDKVGGIAGYIWSMGTIAASQNCGYYSAAENVAKGNYGVVTGSIRNTGGIVGTMGNGTITNSFSNGKVAGKDYVGGIAGGMDLSTIEKCYNTNEAMPLGDIISADDLANKSVYGQVSASGGSAGGIVGYISGEKNTINQVYNAGNISGGEAIGGIVGKIRIGDERVVTISNAYNADNNTVVQDGASYTLAHRDATVTADDGSASGIIGKIDDFWRGGSYTLTNTYVAATVGDTWTEDVSNMDSTLDSSIWLTNANIAGKNGNVTPLLKTFMTDSTLSQQVTYDGTVHSIAANALAASSIYGSASFVDDADGKNVGTRNYDNVTLWSTQSGYNITGTPTLTITPKAVTVTIADATKTYGDTTLTDATNFTIDKDKLAAQLVTGDSIDDIYDTTGFTDTTYNDNGEITKEGTIYTTGLAKSAEVGKGTLVDGTTATEDGTYEIAGNLGDMEGLLGTNYEVTQVTSGALTVNKRPVGYTITSTTTTKTYGDKLTDVGASLTFSDDLAKDELKTDGLTYTVTNTDGADGLASTANAGNYTIAVDADKLTTALGDNYTLTTDTTAIQNGTFTINPKSATYTVNSAEREEGAANPTFSGSFGDTDIVTGDAIDYTKVTYTTTTTVDSPADTYEGDITTTTAGNALGDRAANYSITVVPGTLKIKAKTVDPGAGGGGDNPGTGGGDTPGTGGGDTPGTGGGDTPTDPSKPTDPTDPTKPSDPTEPETKPFTRENDPAGFQHYETITGSSTSTGGNASGDGLGTAASDDSSRLRTATIVGGTTPVEGRAQSRFLTIEDTGINVTSAISAIDGVTIAPSSYASNNGGGAVAPSSTLAGYRGTTVNSALASGQFRPGDLANNADEDELKKKTEG